MRKKIIAGLLTVSLLFGSAALLPEEVFDLGADITVCAAVSGNYEYKVLSDGTAAITVTGKGKYTGTLKKTFKVKALDLSTSYAKVSIPYSSYTWSGSAIRPKVTVKFKDGKVTSTRYGNYSDVRSIKVK